MAKTESAKSLIVFGASGDLMKRYLVPALAELHRRQTLPAQLDIVGSAREPWSDEDFRAKMVEGAQTSADPPSPEDLQAMCARMSFVEGDLTDASSLQTVLDKAKGTPVIYLAVPPSVAQKAVEGLATCSLPADSELVLEKPFGHDLASAEQLNRLLARHFDEDHVYRVDHFLGLRTVRNILAMRFANRVFEDLFHRRHVERVEIVWDETLALEGRAGYFDGTGALRDMLQNHLLQVMAFLAMERPDELRARALQQRKLDVLRLVQKFSEEEAATRSVRGRYGKGKVEGKTVVAYVDEEGVDAKLQTETFAQIQLEVANDRWAGVPFILRSGKALGKNRQEVVVTLRKSDGADLFKWPHPNQLRINLEPDGLALTLNTIADDVLRPMCTAELDGPLPAQPLSPYARVLHSVFSGNNMTAIGAQEAEEAWRIVEPFLDAWHADRTPLHEYAAGSEGPNSTQRAK